MPGLFVLLNRLSAAQEQSSQFQAALVSIFFGLTGGIF